MTDSVPISNTHNADLDPGPSRALFGPVRNQDPNLDFDPGGEKLNKTRQRFLISLSQLCV